MDANILETLFVAVSNGVALFIGAYLARRSAELSGERRAEQEEKMELQRQRREALLERLTLQRRALDEYARMVVRWSSPPVGAPRTKEDDLAADQESIAMYAQMTSAFGSRQFAEQAAATLHAVRAGRGNAQVFPFSVQIASACYQEMIRAMSELEKEIGLPAPRSPARPFLPDEELAKEATRLFSRNVVERSGIDLGMVDQILERVRVNQPEETESSR
ncbi:hypothetical protein SOCE26_074900 [Sorangium cellulosum]|uniref:Uncharacterized protein n=1 Tax=Sorangium cellulosum TaxID=56 RepID=A0A2L0F375_SORCE|nr:hypothetical protein [Sorangium cellulosum]AUX45987.1 hypothetical protein SOCE26_074900 [Sorangium cellulosum]